MTNLRQRQKLVKGYSVFSEYGKNLRSLIASLEVVIQKNTKEANGLEIEQRTSDFTNSLIKIAPGKLYRSVEHKQPVSYEGMGESIDKTSRDSPCHRNEGARGYDMSKKNSPGGFQNCSQKTKLNRKRGKIGQSTPSQVKTRPVAKAKNKQRDRNYNKTNVVSLDFLHSMNATMLQKKKYFDRMIDYVTKMITIHKVT